MTFSEIVAQGCREWQLPVTPEAIARMERFSDGLIEKNRVMNLTAVTEPEEIALRHMLDCLFLLTVTDFQGKKKVFPWRENRTYKCQRQCRMILS